jgi:carotenoid cleavage dioxygenase-like enzyme
VAGDYVTITLAHVSLDFMKSGLTYCLSCSAHDELSNQPTRILIFSLKPSEVTSQGGEYPGPIADISIPPPDAFFVFHHINGWIEQSDAGGDVLVLDMSAYSSMDGVLGDYVLGNLKDILDPLVRDKMPYFPDFVKRLRIDVTAQKLLENVNLPLQDAKGNTYRVDFGTVNPKYHGQSYCIIYAICFHSHNSSQYEDMGLLKIDTCKAYDVVRGVLPADTATVTKEWYSKGVYVGEPIFVANPAGVGAGAGATDRGGRGSASSSGGATISDRGGGGGSEEEGTLLVVTKTGSSSESVLRVFDAHSLEQVAEVTAPFPLMFEFHGQFLASEEQQGGEEM